MSDGESDGSTTQSSHSRSGSVSSSARASSEERFVENLAPMDHSTNGRKRKHEELHSTHDLPELYRPLSKYSQDLLDYFVQPKVEELPNVLLHPPSDFNVNAPIDDEGHTALHWASAMGRLNVVQILCDMNANIFTANNEDQIPLVRSIMFTNNFDNQCFENLITYLRPSITHRNKDGRTVFHQIAIMTSHRSKWNASRYYLDVLIKDLLGGNPAPSVETMTRLRQVLDYQDVNGDTAVTICARNQARKFCRALMRVGVDIQIPNAHGRTAEEYIQEYESQRAQKRLLRNGIGPPATNSNITSYGRIASPAQNPTYPVHAAAASLGNTTSTGAFASAQRTHPRAFQTYVSESAIRATQKIIPQMTEHLEALAASFDAELVDKEADLTQAKHLLSSMEGEIETSRTALLEMTKMFAEVDPASSTSEDVVAVGEGVLTRLRERVESATTKLKMVVERAQARDLALAVQLEESAIQDTTEVKNSEEQMALANELTKLQAERRSLVDRIVDIYANTGCGEKMAGYRRLISLSVGQRPDQVDGLLEQLYQLFMEEEAQQQQQQQQSAVETEDVIMAGNE